MPAINFTGLASGIDTKALIDAILGVERQPITRRENQRALFSQKKAALNELSAKLSSFQSALQELATDRTFRGRTATVADEAVLRATPGTGAETGLFDVEVTALAAAHKVKSEGLSESDEALVADGTITIQSGTNDPITIDVSAANGNNTLEDVRTAINDADAGVQAAILFDGTDYRLTVRAEESGTDNALVITDGTNLNLDAAGNTVNIAADAALSIDGIDITASSNQVVNAIPGVTLDLLDVNTGSPTTVEIAQDNEGVSTAIQTLVDGYNELVDFFNAQDDPNNPGALRGDPTTRSIEQRIRSLFAGGVEGIPFGEIRALSSVGVSFDGKSGRATLDASELNDVLESNFDEVGSLFLSAFRATDSAIQVLSKGDANAGSYAVEITQAAEQATLAGSTAISTLDKNETLTITVGEDEIDVALAKHDTIDDVIDKINTALTAAGIEASATDDAGKLRITTDAYGSAATLTVESSRNDNGNGKRTGFDKTPVTDLGEDVAGKIGGVDATGLGIVLTAAEGQEFSGLSLQVTTTAAQIASQGGDFGTAELSNGFVETLIDTSKLYTRFGDGLLESASSGLETRIDRLGDEIERIEERLSRREIQLINQFSAAENAIAALNAQQSTLGSFRVF